MPRARDGIERVEIEMPADLLAAIQRAREASGESLTTWACRVLARAAGTRYTAPPRGRRPKPEAHP